MTWKSVRVSEATLKRLETARDEMCRGGRVESGELRPDLRDRIGLDQVIAVLLTLRDAHKERARKYVKKLRSAAQS